MTALLEVRGSDPTALATLSAAVERELAGLGAGSRPVTFACIGTDRSTGDALGPLVGQRLRRLGCPEEYVVGTLEHPLHALNMAERLPTRALARPTSLVVAVDAALGPLRGVGTICLRRGGLCPGQGVGKEMSPVGDLSLIATVNVQAGALDAQVLQSTRLFLVQELAEIIGTACWWALRKVRQAAATAASPDRDALQVA